ncbi:MAG: LPS export ABC transporter permease LptF [Pseudomonadota bacterium]
MLRETSTASTMTLAILLAITLALFFAELLGDVGQGQAAASQVFQLLGLRVPEAMLLIGPLALMLGLMMALGQLAQLHELGVFRSAGLTPLRLMRPIVILTVVWMVLLLLIAGWLSPWAERQANQLNQRLAEQLLVASVRPGQFNAIGNDGLSIYVERMDDQSATLSNVFIHFPGDTGIEVITAERGALELDSAQGRRVLTLYDGTHVRHEGRLPSSLQRIEFERNDIYLPSIGGQAGANELSAWPMLALLREPGVHAAIERQSRLAPAIIALLFMLIVMPVSLERPRGNRYGIVLLSLLAFLLYGNAVEIALRQVDSMTWFSRVGLWPMHAVAGLLALGLWLRWQRQW